MKSKRNSGESYKNYDRKKTDGHFDRTDSRWKNSLVHRACKKNQRIDHLRRLHAGIPVSYTHLDVYKRQVCFQMRWSSLLSRECIPLQNIFRNLTGKMQSSPVWRAGRPHRYASAGMRCLRQISCLLYTSKKGRRDRYL